VLLLEVPQEQSQERPPVREPVRDPVRVGAQQESQARQGVSLLELEQQALEQQALRPVQLLVRALRALVLRVQLPQVWELRLLGWRLVRRRHHRYEQGRRLLRQSHPRRQESPE
jgi:hypothetical protein